MIQSQDIRRHRDGCIDFDAYRAQANALRGCAMRDALTFKAMLGLTLVTAALLAAGTFAASVPAHWA